MIETSSNDSLDQLLANYLRRIDEGEHVDHETIRSEQPRHAESLIELIDTVQLISDMAGPTLEEEDGDGDDDEESSSRATPSAASSNSNSEHSSASSPVDAATQASTDSTEPRPLSTTDAGRTRKSRNDDVQDQTESLVGQVIDGYQILSVLGKGGMGVVYKARQASMDRIVALKMILSGRFATSEDVQRFYTEAQAAGRTGHPNIVDVYEVDHCEGQHYFAMEYVEGTDLSEIAKQGPLAPRRVAEYLKTISEAIHSAHESGVLHRDLKPANVLIDAKDRPRVTDFGLAKHVDDDSGLTASGAAVGTPSYMSPEQAKGHHKSVSRRTDVYSLGAILYVLLTGKAPFRSKTSFLTIMDVINADPTAPIEINRDANIDLQTICLKCLSKDPADRYETAGELADEFERFLTGQPILAKPRGFVERSRLWLLNVPLVAAATGRTIVHATPAHQRFQAGMALAVLLFPMFIYFLLTLWQQTLPSQILIASGPKDGAYHAFATLLREPIEESTNRRAVVIESGGSAENKALLHRGGSHLAFLQAADVSDLKSRQLAIVAPVYYEAVHVIVRKSAGIHSFEELDGRAVSLGASAGSSMHASSEMLVRHYGMKLESLKQGNQVYADILIDDQLDAAIVTMGLGSESVRRLLADERLELLPLKDAADFSHPTLRSFTIKRDTYGEGAPPQHIRTVATPAFLVANERAPDALVLAVLKSLYSKRPAAGTISREDAADWPAIAWHRAAQEFFKLQQ